MSRLRRTVVVVAIDGDGGHVWTRQAGGCDGVVAVSCRFCGSCSVLEA